MQASNKTTAFALDPTLPWLFNDPKMQEPAAFRDMRKLTLPEWHPMGIYFPTGTQVAMRLVTELSQLTVGAPYWSEHDWTNEKGELATYWSFGRYAGLDSPESISAKRRWKKGEAHIILECDTLDCPRPMNAYHLRDDGTDTRFVDTKRSYKKAVGRGEYRLYQLTHYITLPAQYLAALGVEAVKQTGLTLRQAVWLEQELEIKKGATEIIAHMTGGPNLPHYRVVVPDGQAANDLFEVWSSLLGHIITPSQAKRCKSVAIASRTISGVGDPYLNLEHYKVADAAPLLEWIRLHSELQRLKIEAAVCAQQMGYRAEAARQERQAYLAQLRATEALRAAQQEGRPEALPRDYASLKELSVAA